MSLLTSDDLTKTAIQALAIANSITPSTSSEPIIGLNGGVSAWPWVSSIDDINSAVLNINPKHYPTLLNNDDKKTLRNSQNQLKQFQQRFFNNATGLSAEYVPLATFAFYTAPAIETIVGHSNITVGEPYTTIAIKKAIVNQTGNVPGDIALKFFSAFADELPIRFQGAHAIGDSDDDYKHHQAKAFVLVHNLVVIAQHLNFDFAIFFEMQDSGINAYPHIMASTFYSYAMDIITFNQAKQFLQLFLNIVQSLSDTHSLSLFESPFILQNAKNDINDLYTLSYHAQKLGDLHNGVYPGAFELLPDLSMFSTYFPGVLDPMYAIQQLFIVPKTSKFNLLQRSTLQDKDDQEFAQSTLDFLNNLL